MFVCADCLQFFLTNNVIVENYFKLHFHFRMCVCVRETRFKHFSD